MLKVSKIFTNKVIFYLLSRYFTYFIQFITSMVIAVKLGPYYLGIWGFILLLLNYFQQVHFGIANSLNVFLVHYKDDKCKSDNYIANSMTLIGGLSLLVFLFALYYYFFGIAYFQKYDLGNYFYWICIIAILQYFNGLFINILRVKNKIMQVAFCQSAIVFLNFICIFFFTGKTLITFLVIGYLLGNLLSLGFVFISNIIPPWRNVQISPAYLKEILRKGLYLFLYNSCFYFIIISVRTIISYYYTVDEFGYFTFSFTLANAIMLLLDAFSFIIFPKIISKLSSSDSNEVSAILVKIRNTYISSAHLLVYIAMVFFPVLLHFMPKYIVALQALNMLVLCVLLNANSFGYTTLLIARNKEKYEAFISLFALALNVIFAFWLVEVMQVKYSFVIIATMITYLVFSFLNVYIGKKMIGHTNIIVALKEFFPFRLLVPYISAFVITLLNIPILAFIPFIAYLAFNLKDLFAIKRVIIAILKNPTIINL